MREYEAFSVSMCVYGGDNPADFDTAVESVVKQSVQPDELVLTVDGPIPETIAHVIEKYRQQLKTSEIAFKVIYLEKNMGHGEARRVCFDNCSCDLIALMDADDISVPDRFEKQLEYYMRHPDLSAVGGQIHEFIGTVENCVGRRIVPETDAEIKEYMKTRCPMNQVTVMFRKNDVVSVGGYIDWFCEEDYYLWLRLAIGKYKFGNVQENLVNVRVSEEMYGRRGGWKYFLSEAKLQNYMLKHGVVGFPTYVSNVMKRFIMQVLMPNSMRAWVYQHFAREK